MEYYNKNELLDRLDKGLDLKDDEYKALIRNGAYKLSERFFMLTSDNHMDTLIEYTVLGTLASNMKYGDDLDRDLPKACGLMITSLIINMINHLKGLKTGDVVLDRLCRCNTVNFLEEVNEIQNFDTLIGELHDSIYEVVRYGFYPESSIDLNKRMDDLKESHNKIKVLRNKYIK